MNKTKTTLSTICLLTTLSAHASQPPLTQKSFFQKTLDAIGQSQPMYWLEKNISARLSFRPYFLDGGPASEQYQKLGKEAQIAAGIPEKYHVPIRRMLHPTCHDAEAITFSKAIYINEESLNQKSYEWQRYVSFHEAIHKKYNDNSMLFLSSPSISVVLYGTLGYIAYKQSLSKPIKTQITLIGATAIASAAIGLKILSNHKRYMEQRADIEGSYATQCSACVERIAFLSLLYGIWSSRKDNGYLESSEFSIIAQDLKKQNKLCTRHEHYV